MTPRLEVADLTVAYGSVTAVESVSFNVEAGECVGVVGESGSGKTSVARVIAGLNQSANGTIRLDGEPLVRPRRQRDRLARARQVQMVFRDPYGSLDPRQRVHRCLNEVIKLHHPGLAPRQRAERVEELLSLVGLTARQAAGYPREMSGGQRQRVGLARALAVDARLYLLDEPVSALDVSIQAQIIDLLQTIQERTGVTFLLITHDLGVVRHMADRCVVMQKGRVVEAGSTDAILTAPSHPYTKRLLASVPRPGWRPDAIVPLTSESASPLAGQRSNQGRPQESK